MITYQRETLASEADAEPARADLFAYILPGMAAMFLLYIADGTTQEIFHENKARTLARFRTVRYRVFPFILSKAIYTLTMLLFRRSFSWSEAG